MKSACHFISFKLRGFKLRWCRPETKWSRITPTRHDISRLANHSNCNLKYTVKTNICGESSERIFSVWNLRNSNSVILLHFKFLVLINRTTNVFCVFLFRFSFRQMWANALQLWQRSWPMSKTGPIQQKLCFLARLSLWEWKPYLQYIHHTLMLHILHH